MSIPIIVDICAFPLKKNTGWWYTATCEMLGGACSSGTSMAAALTAVLVLLARKRSPEHRITYRFPNSDQHIRLRPEFSLTFTP